jgi:hypothetical protein
LYNTRRLHRKALALMKDHFDTEDSPLRGHAKMVDYLQNLSAENIDIVCEFATCVFDRYPTNALAEHLIRLPLVILHKFYKYIYLLHLV